jgi:hypothetical protein
MLHSFRVPPSKAGSLPLMFPRQDYPSYSQVPSGLWNSAGGNKVSGVNAIPDPFWRAGAGAWHVRECPNILHPPSHGVSRLLFVQVRIEHPHQRQIRIEFGDAITLVLIHADPIPLAARLSEFLRAGKGGTRGSAALQPRHPVQRLSDRICEGLPRPGRVGFCDAQGRFSLAISVCPSPASE